MSSQYGKIYPKKAHKDSVHDKDGNGEPDLFGEAVEQGDEGQVPEEGNPYDFRRFLNAVKGRKDEGDKGYASSPDYRSGVGTGTSTVNTPLQSATTTSRKAEPVQKKRKTASVFAPTTKKKQSAKPPATAPEIHLERRAFTRPVASTSAKEKRKSAAAAAAASSGGKIKSAEFVQDTSDSDVDAEGDTDSHAPTPRHTHRHPHKPTLSPGHRASDTEEQSAPSSPASASPSSTPSDAENDDALEIEIPDAKPHRKNTSHLHVHTSATRGLRSPSGRPISLASAANSVVGSPVEVGRLGRVDDDEIDFGEVGGGEGDAEGEEDEDVEMMELGPPVRAEGKRVSGGGGAAGAGAGATGSSGAGATGSGGGGGGGAGGGVSSTGPAAGEDDEDDPLFQEMMQGLAEGESSEESEEE